MLQDADIDGGGVAGNNQCTCEPAEKAEKCLNQKPLRQVCTPCPGTGVTKTTTTTIGEESPVLKQGLEISGSDDCNSGTYDGRWEYQEETADGKEYYAKEWEHPFPETMVGKRVYLHFDRDCNGDDYDYSQNDGYGSDSAATLDKSNKWFFSSVPINPSAEHNLDNNSGFCMDIGRLVDADETASRIPPAHALWEIWCYTEQDGAPEERRMQLTITPIATDISVTTIAKETTAKTSTSTKTTSTNTKTTTPPPPPPPTEITAPASKTTTTSIPTLLQVLGRPQSWWA